MKITILSGKNNLSIIKDKATVLTPDGESRYTNRDKLPKEYIDFIGGLNKKYNSLMWWTSSISSKNQWISHLYRNIFYYIEIIETIKKSNSDKLFIKIEDYYLIKQLKKYCEQNNIKCVKIRKINGYIIKTYFRFLRSIVQNVAVLFTGWKYKYLTEKYLGKHIKEQLKNNQSYYVLRTWIDKRSFDKNGHYNDIYYGTLVDYIKNKENLVIFGVILNSHKKHLQKIKDDTLDKPYIIVPLNYVIKYIDYLRSLLLQWKIFFSLKNKISSKDTIFQQHDIYYLLKQELINDLFRGEYRNNLFYYYANKNFAKQINSKYYIFPCENHSWELLTTMAFKKYSKDTFMVGYQHGAILPKELNYFPSKNEKDILPLPNKIITVGKKAKDILEKYGNYPEKTIKTGCALRYEYLFKKKMKKRILNKKILVAFSTDAEESSNLLTFLIKSFEKETTISLLIKPHPDIPIKNIVAHQKLPKNFEIITDKSIEELLMEIDLFIYCGTTVCMEALMMGIPLIYIDINKFYDCDPLFECNHLKWTVKHEKDLIETINKIYDMDDKNFKKQQKQAKEYMKDYFSPVNDKGLREFIG
jgi:hypothetical protein